MSKPLIVISKNPSDLIFAETCARVAGVPIVPCATFQDAASNITSGNFSSLFLSCPDPTAFQPYEAGIQSSIGLFSDLINPNGVFILGSMELSHYSEQLHSPVFSGFIQTNYADPKTAAEHFGRTLRQQVQVKPFGLSSFFGADVKTQKITLKQASQKQNTVEAVRNFLLQAQFKARMASTISNAVDELVMNAIFDAPIDLMGKQLYESTPRTENISLEGQAQVEIEIAFDGTFVAVAVSDLFGSLQKSKLLGSMSERYDEEEYKIKLSKAGAGIGLATVFNTGGSLRFACEKGTRTEVSVYFRRTDNHREFKDQFKFLTTEFHH